ncbi:MAG: ABC transporter permease [Actinomycetota bacterium]|nr:ABC transporter permease [Actinomycetota bacterium]
MSDLHNPYIVPGEDAGEVEHHILDAAPPTPKAKFEWSTVFGPLALFIVFMGLWQYMHESGLRTFFDKPGFLVPSPVTVINESFMRSRPRGKLLTGLQWTAFVAFIGLAITIVVGMALATIMARAKWAERAVYPYLVALQAMPVLAIVPVIAAVFGYGLGPRIFVCVMISIFPVASNTLFGLLSVDKGQHDLFTLSGASRLTRLFKLQFPSAMPAIFTGFRISAGLSVIGAVVGEQFFRQGSKPGIGIVIEEYRQKIRFPQIYGGLVLVAALGIAVFLLFGWLTKVVVGHWHESTR